MSFDSMWQTALTGLSAIMAVIPNVPALYFLAVLGAGWAALFLALAITIEFTGARDRALKTIVNAFWIYMAAATIAFILTRQSPLHALGWFLLCSVVLEVLFINAMAVKDRWDRAERWSWRWVLAGIIGAPLFIVGFPIDVQYNLTWGRLMFLQKPHLFDELETSPWDRVLGGEWAFTETLQRNVEDFTWQGVLARSICRWGVEPWDPGHCGKLPALRAVR
jgi:MFS family permease